MWVWEKTSSDKEQMESNWSKCPIYTITKESKSEIIALALNYIQKKTAVFSKSLVVLKAVIFFLLCLLP